MNLIRRDNAYRPLSEVDRLREEINQLFDLGSDDDARGLFDRSVSPPVDLVENEDGFVITCDLPGVEQKNLDVSIANNVLTIHGEKHREKNTEGEESPYRREIWTGSFQRTISLPPTANPDDVEADMKNGVLTVHIGKREEARPRRITVGVQ
jgi:HSP20 family protein